MLAEVGPAGSQVEIVASGKAETGGIDYGPDGGITYVQNLGAWNPVIAVERVVSKTSTTKHTRLDIGERVSGVWNWGSAPVLERQDSDRNDGFFYDVEPFTKSDNTLGFVAPHCGMLIYAERRVSGWTYWDVGPVNANLTDRYTRVSFSETGAPILARRSAYNGVIQINHPDLNRPSFTPPLSCTNVASSLPNAWEDIGGVAHQDLAYVSVAAVAERSGNIYLAASAIQPNGKSTEPRLIYRCTGDASWQVKSIDP